MKTSPLLPFFAACWLLLCLAAPPVCAAVHAVVLNPTFLEYPKITPPTPDLWVGHYPFTGPSGRSYVRHVDFDGDGAWEVRLHGDIRSAVQAEAASHVQLVGLAYDTFYVHPCLNGAIIGEEAVFENGTAMTDWNNPQEVSDFTILWGALGSEPSPGTPWGQVYNQRPFMGVRFQKDDGWHYGWIQVGWWLGSTGYLGGWAWETEPDTPIIAGAIPEPSAAGLLLCSGGALLLSRRGRGTGGRRENPRQ